MDNVQSLENQILSEMTNRSVETGPIHDVLIIDAESRTIIVPETELIFGVTDDKDAERKYFSCPKIVGDNIDLSKLSLRVHFENANSERDKYIVDDVLVSGDNITFSWLLSDKALAYNGELKFTIVAVTVNGDGTVSKAWNTTLSTGTVLEGLEVEDLNETEETEVRDVLQQLLDLLENHAGVAVYDVMSEGNTQIDKVKAEGAAQIEAVEDKGLKTLATIPEDYTAMSNQVDLNTRNLASVIKQETSGDTILIDDSASHPLLGLNLYGKSKQESTNGKQLCDLSNFPNFTAGGTTSVKNDDGTTTVIGGGATVVNNGDGSLSISGTGTLSSLFSARIDYTHEETVKILKAGTLYCKFGATTVPRLYIQLNNSTGTLASMYNHDATTRSMVITQDMLDQDDTFLRFSFYQIEGTTIVPGTIKPMLYQDGDGTWEPFSGGKPAPNPDYPQDIVSIENPTIYIRGKNLFNIDGTLNDQFVCNKNGSYTLTRTGSYRFSKYTPMYIPSNTSVTITISGYTDDSFGSLYVQLMMDDGSTKSLTFTRDVLERVISYNQAVTSIRVYLIPDSVDGDYVTFSNIQVEFGRVSTDFEKYSGSSVETQRVLQGLPVSSGGNYTDANGQQWICDEIDFERGVYIQRAELKTFTLYKSPYEFTKLGYRYQHHVGANFTLGNTCLCRTLPYNEYVGTDVDTTDGVRLNNSVGYIIAQYTDVEGTADAIDLDILYLLPEPIEIPLTESELLAFRSLSTNYGKTTVINDSGALQRVVYGTDTKLYIDNKFAEIRDLLSNS